MIPLSHGLILSSILFSLGMLSLMLRKNLLYILISLEVMVHSIALTFICISNYWEQSDGQIIYIIILTTTAVEVSIMLGLLIQLYQSYKTLNVEILSEMKK